MHDVSSVARAVAACVGVHARTRVRHDDRAAPRDPLPLGEALAAGAPDAGRGLVAAAAPATAPPCAQLPTLDVTRTSCSNRRFALRCANRTEKPDFSDSRSVRFLARRPADDPFARISTAPTPVPTPSAFLRRVLFTAASRLSSAARRSTTLVRRPSSLFVVAPTTDWSAAL